MLSLIIIGVLVIAVIVGIMVGIVIHKHNALSSLDDGNTSTQDDNVSEPEAPATDVFSTSEFVFQDKLLPRDIVFNVGRGYFAFHEGLAWVYGSDHAGKQARFLINTAGRIVYSMDMDLFADVAYENRVSVTPFKNGISCVYPVEYHYASVPGFLIVDNKGKEVYSDMSDTFCVCGMADDGTIFLSKHVSNISEDYYRLCTIDHSLDLKETAVTSEQQFTTNVSARKIQGDLYFFDNYNSIGGSYDKNHYIVDLNRPIYWNLTDYTGMSSIRVDGDYLNFNLLDNDGESRCTIKTFVQIVSNATDVKAVVSALYEQAQNIAFPKELKTSYDFYSDRIPLLGGCWIFGDKHEQVASLLDYQGNVIGTLDPLPGEAEYKFSSHGLYHNTMPFFGDLSTGIAARLIGADKKIYYTYFDKNGKMQYTPVPFAYDDMRQIEDCFAGYVFLIDKDNIAHVLDPQGQETEIGRSFSGFKDSDSYFTDVLNISEGWIFFHGVFAKVDGSKTLSSVDVNYDKDGNIIYG